MFVGNRGEGGGRQGKWCKQWWGITKGTKGITKGGEVGGGRHLDSFA